MEKPFTFKAYDFNLTAGGSQTILAGGEYFRILSSTGALDVTVEGKGTMPDLLAGQAIKGLPFQRLVLRDKSGAPNTGFILVASSEFVDNRLFGTFDLSASTLAALASVDLKAATLNTLTRPLLPVSSWNSSAALVANTPLTIFTPAANTSGALILSMKARDDVGAATTRQVFIAKSSAPSSITDGEILAMTLPGSVSGTSDFAYIDEQQPTRIAAGLGLYYLSSLGSGSAGLRSCRYTLL